MKRISYKTGDFINGIQFICDIKSNNSNRKARFKCFCGKEFDCLIGSIKTSNTTSCGCNGILSRKKVFTKHGLRNHPIYRIWQGIKTRCYNKNRVDYKYYGGVGIILSEEFKDFKVFYDYVTLLPDYENRERLRLTIDRVDVRKNYEKNNLRWATRKQQSLNQRRNSQF
jgi:hypothetical protein